MMKFTVKGSDESRKNLKVTKETDKANKVATTSRAAKDADTKRIPKISSIEDLLNRIAFSAALDKYVRTHSGELEAEDNKESGHSPLLKLLADQNVDGIDLFELFNTIMENDDDDDYDDEFDEDDEDEDDEDDDDDDDEDDDEFDDDDDDDDDEDDDDEDDDDEDDDDEDDDDEDDDDEDDDELPSATITFLREQYKPNVYGEYIPRPRVKCKDGYTVSIQAGSSLAIRCWPNKDTKKFTHVMLDTPSYIDAELLPYCMNPENKDDPLFCFVPVRVVDEIIEKHGGIVGTYEPSPMSILLCMFSE